MEVTHPDVQKMANAAEKFCNRWFNDAPGTKLLVFAGPTGCGKTHIARRVSNWASAAAFTRWTKLESLTPNTPSIGFDQWSMFASPERTPEREFVQWLEDVRNCSVFVLDDIGVETDQYKSGIAITRLCEFLNRRAGKFTMITTNEPLELWKDRWDARVEDRLLRDSEIVAINAPSFATMI